MAIRFLIVALIMLSTFVTFMTRVNLNVAIVSMAKEVIQSDNKTEMKDVCPYPESNLKENETKMTSGADQYDWSEPDQVCSLLNKTI